MKAVVDFSISRRLGGKSRPAALTSMSIRNLPIGLPVETLSHDKHDTTRHSGQRAA